MSALDRIVLAYEADVEELAQALWYERHACSHAHCPCNCEKPQPRFVDGVFACGYCAVMHGMICEMIPCTPENCGDDA